MEPHPNPIRFRPAMRRSLTLSGVLLAATWASAADNPSIDISTGQFTAAFARGSLCSLVDRDGHVYVRPATRARGLSLHRVEATHDATSRDDAGAGPPGPFVCRYEFADLDGAAAECTFAVDDATGDLTIAERAVSPRPGVWGVGWWIETIPLDYAIVVPGRSGLRLTADTPGREHTFDYPTGWEAQLVIVEGRNRGFYVWADDVKGRFKRLVVERNDDGWRLGLITINFAPFDDLTECDSVAWRANVYRGDWRVPARRYRDWAEAHFRPTPIAEHEPSWVKDMRTLVIMGMDVPVVEALAERLDPEQTVLYVPGWRAAGYDRDYPTYDEPVERLAPFVRRAHELGYRVMLHVNYFGVDPLHPLYENFEPYQVRSPWGDHEKLWWLWTRAEPEIRFAYVNPALKAWRDHFVEAMVKLCRDYAIDALHLDQTLCLYNDHNGPIDGMTMIEGNLALHRQLREALPHVALSGEGLNEITYRHEAFAQRHAWGVSHTEGTWDRRRLAAAHPISSYLFRPYTIINGYLGCAPPTRGQLYAAWNEAYEHWGVIPTLKPELAQVLDPTGFSRQFFDESRFWQQRRLAIDVEGPWPDDVAFPFRTADGKRALRMTDGRFVVDGQEISRTITGVHRLETSGNVPGWRAYDDRRLLGLDPECWYPCFDEPRDPDAFHVAELPDEMIAEAVVAWDAMALVRTRSNTTVVADLTDLLDRATCGSRPFDGEPTETTGPLAADDGARFEPQGNGIFAHPPWKVRRTDPDTGRTTQSGTGVAFARFDLELPHGGTLRFVADVALNRGALGPDKSDGVTFSVEVESEGADLRREVHHAADQRRRLELDLTALAGRRIALELAVHPGPNRSPSYDWARWERPRIEREAQVEGSIAVAGSPGGWSLALAGRRPRDVASNAAGHRVVVPLPGTVFFLAGEPDAVSLPVDLASRPRQVAFSDRAGLPLESPRIAGVRPGPARVGGIEREGLHAHPPDEGRTVAHLPMTLPSEPAVLRCWIGIRDGSESTGVVFVVEVNGDEVARQRMVPGAWHPLSADLAPWAGQPVVVSLMADSDGPFNFDWAHWGEPTIEPKGATPGDDSHRRTSR